MTIGTGNLTVSALLREACYIGGRWVTSDDWIEVTDPATGERVGAVPRLDEADAEKAVISAEAAFAHWSKSLAKNRARILRRWAELMLENETELAELLTREQGKPLAEARGEVAYAASFLEWFSEEARRVTGEVITPHALDKRLVVNRRPVGVVGAITPWNFPLAMITRKAAPALAAGCTFIVKPSELTPFSALALAVLAEQAGVPDGVFNVITGNPEEIGRVLTTDPRVRKFTFTGSTNVGKKLAGQCAGTVKRVSLELGGNAPFIIFADADLDAAVEGAIASKFRNTGQTCVCANRFLVQSEVHEQFAALLADRVKRMKVGAGLSGPTDQGPLINESALKKVETHVADAVANGGTIFTGGSRHPAGGLFFQPTVIADAPSNALFNHQETFGPVAGLIRFDTEEDAITLANDTRAGLAAYVYTRDAGRQWRMMDALEYGMVGINTGVISTEVAPFGGMKESGLGREGSSLGMDEYLDVKLACISI